MEVCGSHSEKKKTKKKTDTGYEWRGKERESERERMFSWCLIAGYTLRRSATQTHNYSIQSYYQTEREMEGERQTESRAHFDEYYTERRSAFTRAVITATHSVHLTSPLHALSSLSVIHGVLVQREQFARVIEITGFL